MNLAIIGDKDRIIGEYNDYHIIDRYNFGIDDVKALRVIDKLKSHSNNKLLLAFYTITEEAQNAMLKMLEESENIHFVICVPDVNVLLPTVRSRLQIRDMRKIDKFKDQNTKNENQIQQLVLTMLKQTPQQRLKNKDIIALYEKETDKGNKMKDNAHRFVVALTSELLLRYQRSEYYDLAMINRLNVLAEYIMKPGSSAKLIMEWICLSV